MCPKCSPRMSSIRFGHWTFHSSSSVGVATRIRQDRSVRTADRPPLNCGMPGPRCTPDLGRRNVCPLCQRRPRSRRRHREVHQRHSFRRRRSNRRSSKCSHLHKLRNLGPPPTSRQEVASGLRLQPACQRQVGAVWRQALARGDGLLAQVITRAQRVTPHAHGQRSVTTR